MYRLYCEFETRHALRLQIITEFLLTFSIAGKELYRPITMRTYALAAIDPLTDVGIG